jgi:hypothetical protein
MKITARGRTLRIEFRSAQAARKAKEHLERILDESSYHQVEPEDTFLFYHHTLDLLAMQYNEEGSFIERMKKGEVAGVY